MTSEIAVRKADRAKFQRLAVARTNKAIKHIRLIGNLSNRSNYHYTPQEVARIFATLKEECEDAQSRFARKEPKPFELE